MRATLDRPGANPTEPTANAAEPASSGSAGIAIAGLASLGAGAVHAAAIGIHAEHRPAVIAFAVLAGLQLGWGAAALVRSGRGVMAMGLLLHAAAFVGWVVAKAAGIPFVTGLTESEPVQTADAVAAGMALATVIAITATWLAGGRTTAAALRRAVPVAVVLTAGLSLLGMVAAGTHRHATAADHSDAEPARRIAAAVAPVPYDPKKPIDLGGVEGVTPAQQAAAENLVSVTLLRLPKWTDPAVAEAAGFRTIGDGRTGVEHLVNQEFMDDDVVLDPDRPESLVYDTLGGGRRLVAAMYMLERGLPLENAPNIGGKLMQWHTHVNLCYNAQGRVAGLTDAAGNCPAGLFKPVPTPMIHVWIEPHKCGPFAALEGIAGGRIPDGETVLCDHAHGS